MYRLAGDVDGWAEVSGRFRHEATAAADFPAVGDWVGSADGIIHRRLDRRSTLSRVAAGRVTEEQVVAANADIVFLVTAVGDDLSVRRLVETTFDDVAALAVGCPFGDCAHDSEPDCAVRAAVADGRLSADRLEHFRHLLREAAYEHRRQDKAAAAEHKRRWKRIHQANKALYKDRDRT